MSEPPNIVERWCNVMEFICMDVREMKRPWRRLYMVTWPVSAPIRVLAGACWLLLGGVVLLPIFLFVWAYEKYGDIRDKISNIWNAP